MPVVKCAGPGPFDVRKLAAGEASPEEAVSALYARMMAAVSNEAVAAVSMVRSLQPRKHVD
jgi:hypothetical protein